MSTARIDQVVVPGVFSLDGQDFDVENNVWLVGDDDEVLVIDAPHDATPILAAIGGRRVVGIVLTHGHNDHITAAVALREATGAPTWFHPEDRMLWDVVHGDGSTCLHAPQLGTVFTSDTLFCGGPGATGRSSSDHPTIVRSIRERLFALAGDTVVRTGHGEATTIAAELGNVD